jgi:hypothetical protein
MDFLAPRLASQYIKGNLVHALLTRVQAAGHVIGLGIRRQNRNRSLENENRN